MLKLEPEHHTAETYRLWLDDSRVDRTIARPLSRRSALFVVEEIKGVTWDLDGAELDPWQGAQRLYQAGFTNARLLGMFWAVLEAESGGYLKAWHHNVTRNDDGSIWRDEGGLMEVRSTDLGFIQRNVRHSPTMLMPSEGDQSALFVNDLFNAFPELANGWESADIAHDLYVARGFQPWYAYSNGSYKRSLPRSGIAVGNFIDKMLNGADGHQLIRRVK